jgi:hypothetical protein
MVLKITEVDIEHIKFTSNLETIEIPLTVEKDSVKKSAVLLYHKMNRIPDLIIKKPYPNMNYDKETISVVKSFQQDDNFINERSKIQQYIFNKSIERPIPKLVITRQYASPKGSVSIYFKGEGINKMNKEGYVSFFHHLALKDAPIVMGVESTYLGYQDKVIAKIREKSKLYILLHLGE